MKRHSSLISLGLVFILWFGLAFKCNFTSNSNSNSNSNGGGSTVKQPDNGSSRFVGAWKPASDDRRTVGLEFVINDDGTFVFKWPNENEADTRGSYTMTGDKLKLVWSGTKRADVTMADDGRLKLVFSNDEDQTPLPFVRK